MNGKFRQLVLFPLLLLFCALLPRTARAYTAADSARLQDLIHDKIWEGAEKIEFNAMDYGGITETEINRLCSLLYREPDMFILNPNSGFSSTRVVEDYTIVPPYLPSLLPSYPQAKQEYSDVLTDLLSGVDPGWTTLEKILCCHDIICTRYKRNYVAKASGQVPGEYNTAYKMMTAADDEGNYRCEGTDTAYAMLFKAMVESLNLSGVQCSYASGTFKDETVHNWNILKLDDGSWYNVEQQILRF